jgi:hypothetical protein
LPFLPTEDATAVADEGAFVPLLIGRRRIGYYFGWVGDRKAYKVHSGAAAGKGGANHKKSPPAQLTWVESGWHQLCVGPATKLHRIWQDDVVIFEGLITPEDTPSGTALQTLNGEEFVIYWGEIDQPVDSYLADASRVGIPSNWPYMCYVRWTNKTLGSSPHWGRIEYDLETAPQYSLCGPRTRFYGTDTADTFYLGPGASISSGPFTGVYTLQETTGGALTLGTKDSAVVPATGYYRLYADSDPDLDGEFAFGVQTGGNDAGELTTAALKIRDTAGEQTFWEQDGTFGHVVNPPDGECEDFFAAGSNPTYGAFDVVARHGMREIVTYLEAGAVDLWIEGTIVAATGGLNFRPIFGGNFFFVRLTDVHSGPAPVNALAQILFSPFPHGLGLDPAEFDLDTFHDVDLVLDAEQVVLSVIAKDGDEAFTVVGKALTELGVFMVLNPETGLYELRAQRSGQTPKVIPTGMITENPEVVGTRGERPATRLIYSFHDQTDAFSGKSLTVDADGAQTALSRSKPKTIELETVVDLVSASSVAQRDAQRELGGDDKVSLEMNRGARLLIPGDRLDVSSKGFEEFLRVLEVAPKADGRCTVTASPDHYGVPVVVYSPPTSGGGSSSAADPVEDLQVAIVEVPAYLLAGGAPAVVVPRVRDNAQIIFSDLYLSGDGTTYHSGDREFNLQTGGTLIDPIGAADPWVTDGAYTFTLLGPDADQIEDFSSDQPAFLAGRQVCVIDDEIFFLEKVTAMGGAVYRLDGLIRARYDTDPAAHVPGAKVSIFSFDAITSLLDPLFLPDQLLYVKSDPWTSRALDLGSVTAVTKTLKGKGIAPMNPTSLRVITPRLGVAGYFTTEDLRFAWDYRTLDGPTNGAGMQPAGQPIGSSDVQGYFEVRIYDSMDVLVRTENVATPLYYYPNATLQADLGGETDFRVEVRNVDNGFSSDPITLSIVAL